MGFFKKSKKTKKNDAAAATNTKPPPPVESSPATPPDESAPVDNNDIEPQSATVQRIDEDNLPVIVKGSNGRRVTTTQQMLKESNRSRPSCSKSEEFVVDMQKYVSGRVGDNNNDDDDDNDDDNDNIIIDDNEEEMDGFSKIYNEAPVTSPFESDNNNNNNNNNNESNNNNSNTDNRSEVTRELVKKFIADIWNRGELDLIPQVCSKNIRFNGNNNGMDKVGHDGFARMVATIHAALSEYHCEIHSMVVEGNKAFCRLRFTGRHVGVLLGYPPTHQIISWMGATEFTISPDHRILKVWELGDMKTLEQQLQQNNDNHLQE